MLEYVNIRLGEKTTRSRIYKINLKHFILYFVTVAVCIFSPVMHAMFRIAHMATPAPLDAVVAMRSESRAAQGPWRR
jgi:hypothetical protein